MVPGEMAGKEREHWRGKDIVGSEPNKSPFVKKFIEKLNLRKNR